MSDSKNLDKYGVWVKNSPKDIKGEDFEMPENAIDDIDLPSDDEMFNDIDFPLTAEDLPKEENKEQEQTEISDLDIDIDIPEMSEESSEETSADENADTTLSADELLNITGDMEGGADENADTTLSADELMNITGDMEGGADENADTTLSADELMNITEGQNAQDGMDDFNLDDLDMTSEEPKAAQEEPAVEDAAEEPATEEISLDDIPDGEVDLDDFMGSDSPAPSVDSTPDGEVDLSDFMGGDDGEVDLGAFMDDAPSSKKEAKPEEINDEQSLDIDVSFDDTATDIAMEDNTQEEAEAPAEEKKPAAAGEDMFAEFGDGAEIQKAAPSAISGGDTEEIDLSDFGFDDDDSNIGMTNGPDGAAQQKAEVVDYEMKVSADDDSKTPSVQDVLSGNVESADESDADDFAATESAAAPAASPEISQKGQEILSQIMGELSSLRDEIKNLKTDFEGLKDRPTPAAENASIPAAKTEAEKEENTGFFGDDDGDDTIALSGNELTNILSSAEFSTEEPAGEPAIQESAEPEFEETAIGGEEISMEINDSDMEEPTIDTTEITPEDLAGTTDEFGEENVLPEEISVPKIDDDITVESSSSDLMDSVVNTDMDQPQETFNSEAIDEIMQEDVSIADSLDDEKINYMKQDLENDDLVSVDDIVQENVSMQDDSDNVAVGIGDDINAAFEEADATEADITDSALAEKDAYENSVSDIMKENVSLQEDSDNVAVGVGDDINAAFEEAEAVESDITDSALAEKDAYENKKAMEDEFSLDIGDEPEDPVPETLDESVLRDSSDSEPAIDDTVIDESIFDDEPETSVDVPVQETAAAAATIAAAGAASEKTAISKDLKSEIVSVLSYMDQLLENLPEEKITEFAKSEHFVTYKKLFDELGLS